jgi:hypothetical protein
MAITKAPDKINKSVQEIQNLGFDTEFNLPVREMLVYNPITSEVDRMVQNPTSLPLPSGAATSANQQPPSITPTVYNLTLTLANTEYSQALPANTREFRFRCRTLYDVRFSYETGKVATPTAPYLTLPMGSDYWSDWCNLSTTTIYFASSTAGVVIEIECWA